MAPTNALISSIRGVLGGIILPQPTIGDLKFRILPLRESHSKDRGTDAAITLNYASSAQSNSQVFIRAFRDSHPKGDGQIRRGYEVTIVQKRGRIEGRKGGS